MDELYREAGFIDRDEMLLYQDVCCTEIPVEKNVFEDYIRKSFEDIKFGKRNKDASKKANLFSKVLYEQYIIDNMLEDLFYKVNGMNSVDRLIEIYIYYFNKLSVCVSVRKKLEL